MNSSYSWDGDWEPILDEEEARRFAAELVREVCSSHVLYGQDACALARRRLRDDFLFRLDDGRFAQVHLTWHTESLPDWPSTNIFESFEAWKAVPPEDR